VCYFNIEKINKSKWEFCFLKLLTIDLYLFYKYVCLCRYVFIIPIYSNPCYYEINLCIFLKLIGFPAAKLGLSDTHKPFWLVFKFFEVAWNLEAEV